MRRTSALVSDLWNTLKNTARWQISSSMLHGFMGTLQSAYGYAQDLNESLNNIRIVTGANVDEMARFAEEANKAAKALNTTTTAYTNASLIYFQQGLSDQQVKERTDITIKMANVSRQSAETVSDQMTAVWNNFYDGSKSLEYYADVMTALGAATASSTEEISEGLEKFAAIADTVGLSFDYAASALATVTATTRQSADVVGTAFKTLFARIQDLELGKTLDDGTTLGKYSAALSSVGIEIKDTSG
jgi:TP901 family phage tail tape measure protein